MTQPKELELLSSDCAEVRDFVESRYRGLAQEIGGSSTARRNLIFVAADLFYRVVDLAQGTGACLQNKLFSSTHAVQRGLLESHVNLLTIRGSEDPERLAWLLASYTRLKRSQLNEAGEPDAVDALLEEVPPELYKEAEDNLRTRRGWCGKSVWRMMSDLGLSYDIYAWTSEEAHGRGIGMQAELIRNKNDGSSKVRLGRALEDDTVELIANVTRSIVLNSGSAFWEIAMNETPEFATLDPRFSAGGRSGDVPPAV